MKVTRPRAGLLGILYRFLCPPLSSVMAAACGVALGGSLLVAARTHAAEPAVAAPPSDKAEVENTDPVPRKAARPAAGAAAKPTSGPSAQSRKSPDRLELDKTVVTGNRELPKVLYIVPWKKANLGDLPGQPFNSLLDEALTPVDRDVFRRELRYYDTLEAGAGHSIESGQVEK
jgi:hypothetical protein